MQVFIEKSQTAMELEHSGSARSLLERIDVSPDVVLIVKDGTLITPEDAVDGAQKIELLSVISGG